MPIKISPLAPKTFKKTQKIDGVRVSSLHCGLKNKSKHDLVLIKFDLPSTIFGVFTKSNMPGESIKWNKSIIKKKKVSAILINAGNANVFNGEKGKISQQKIIQKISKDLGLKKNQIYIASTGVIGEPLKHEKIIKKIPILIKSLNNEASSWFEAAEAIRTTDTFPKIYSKRLKSNRSLVINGIAKGSGMIAPNMATMLSFITTNVNLSDKYSTFKKIFNQLVDETFNSISVDGDTSTSDMVLLVSVNNKQKKNLSEDSYLDFKKSLKDLMQKLAHLIVKDGEGASKFISISVNGTKSDNDAKKVGFSVANSPLFKTAMAGSDLNWGRIIMSIGKSGFKFKEKEISIKFGNYVVVKDGKESIESSSTLLRKYLKKSHIEIFITLGIHKGKSTVWTCDLTKEYISINTNYRS